jgi:hypothetical protein
LPDLLLNWLRQFLAMTFCLFSNPYKIPLRTIKLFFPLLSSLQFPTVFKLFTQLFIQLKERGFWLTCERVFLLLSWALAFCPEVKAHI